MSDNRSLPDSGQSSGSVFSIFRGSDRYSQFDDDDAAMMSTSPPAMHDFPEPIRFKPRKSKFHSMPDTEGQSASAEPAPSQLKSLEGPKIILSNPSGTTSRISSEVFKQQFTTKYDSRRVSFDSSSPHGSVEISPSSRSTVTLFEKAHLVSTEKKHMNNPLSKFDRRASDSNVFSSMAGVVANKGSKFVVPTSDCVVKVAKESENVQAKKEVKPTEIKAKVSVDAVDAGMAGGTSFSGWLFGGKKKFNPQNKDMNVIGPTSF